MKRKSLCTLFAPLVLVLTLAGCGEKDDDHGGIITGNGITLDANAIHYSASDLLSATPTTIWLVGLPDAASQAGGVLRVTNRDTGASVDGTVSTTGSFVIAIAAHLNDTLELEWTLREDRAELDITVTDALDNADTPRECGMCSIRIFQRINDTEVEVNLGGLSQIIPPYVVINEQQNVSLMLTDPDTPVRIRAGADETICLFQLGEQGNSPGLCSQL